MEMPAELDFWSGEHGEVKRTRKKFRPPFSPLRYTQCRAWEHAPVGGAAGAWRGLARVCAWTQRTAESPGGVPTAAQVHRDGCEASVRRRASRVPRGWRYGRRARGRRTERGDAGMHAHF
jgi:hypothetical protein